MKPLPKVQSQPLNNVQGELLRRRDNLPNTQVWSAASIIYRQASAIPFDSLLQSLPAGVLPVHPISHILPLMTKTKLSSSV